MRLKPNPKKYILVELNFKQSFGFLIPTPFSYLHSPKLEDIHEGEGIHNLLNSIGILIILHDISLFGLFYYYLRDKREMRYTPQNLIDGLKDISYWKRHEHSWPYESRDVANIFRVCVKSLKTLFQIMRGFWIEMENPSKV